MQFTDFFLPFEKESRGWADVLPILPLTGTVLFPDEPMTLNLSQEELTPIEMASQSGGYVLAAQVKEKKGGTLQFYRIGTVARVITQETTDPQNSQVAILGFERAQVQSVDSLINLRFSKIQPFQETPQTTSETIAFHLEEEILIRVDFLRRHNRKDLVKFELENVIDDLAVGTVSLEEMCDLVAAAVPFSGPEKQTLLEEPDLIKRAEKLQFLLDTLILPTCNSLRP